MPDSYPMEDVLAIASIHPFYSDAKYPPTRADIPSALTNAKQTSGRDRDLKSFPLTRKSTLENQIARLTNDLDPRNGYRQETYVSVTGGGSGQSAAMVFATDSAENRKQRAVIGVLLRKCGILGPGDWMLTVHAGGNLYRALDLMSEVFESAGATVISAGAYMPNSAVAQIMAQYGVNAISGDTGQLVQLARHIASLPEDDDNGLRKHLRVNKVLYTSESMTPVQRNYLKSVFGEDLAISSVIGSAEAGPWAVSTAEMTEHTMNENYADFVFDTRFMHLEVLPLSLEEGEKPSNGINAQDLPDGEKGLMVQTSLQRLRNPLVRYVCGDLASFRPLPESTKARLAAVDADVGHYQLVRVYGRDRRFSFEWYGEYYEFQDIQAAMRTESWGVLHYQLVIRPAGSDQLALNPFLEVRVLRCSEGNETKGKIIGKEELVEKIKKTFKIYHYNIDLFGVTFLEDYSGFVRSETGRKVLSLVDLTWK